MNKLLKMAILGPGAILAGKAIQKGYDIFKEKAKKDEETYVNERSELGEFGKIGQIDKSERFVAMPYYVTGTNGDVKITFISYVFVDNIKVDFESCEAVCIGAQTNDNRIITSQKLINDIFNDFWKVYQVFDCEILRELYPVYALATRFKEVWNGSAEPDSTSVISSSSEIKKNLKGFLSGNMKSSYNEVCWLRYLKDTIEYNNSEISIRNLDSILTLPIIKLPRNDE